jgi:hypothetical protein
MIMIAYSEGNLVKQPAIELFAGLGWQTIGAFDMPGRTLETIVREVSA